MLTNAILQNRQWRKIGIIENTENTNPNYDFFCIFSLSHISHDNLNGGIKSDNLMFFEPVITYQSIQCLDFYTLFFILRISVTGKPKVI